MLNKSSCLSFAKVGLTALIASCLLSACVGYVSPEGNWIPGHYGPRGGWIPGHYGPAAPVVVAPIVVGGGKYVPGHIGKSGWWKPGHWK